jgi:hypothetical protein
MVFWSTQIAKYQYADLADVEAITRRGLQKRAIEMLAPPTSMFGIKGMRKLARELTKWPEELDAKQINVSPCHLVEFTGFPPIMPNRLTGYGAPDNHAGERDVFAGLLRQLADAVVDYILGQTHSNPHQN